jgi:prevent-host-death family protein
LPLTKQYSIAQARDRLPSIVHEVERGQPVELTRRGRPVAVVMSLRDYERIAGRRPGFAAALAAFLASTEPGELGFVDEDFAGLRDRSPGRDLRC